MKLATSPKKIQTVAQLSFACLSLVAGINQANAFLVDNSNQKTIMIGKAGETMQSVQVNALPAPPPSTNVQVTQSYPQQQYPQTIADNSTTYVAQQPIYNAQTGQYITTYDPYQQAQTQQAYQQYQQQTQQYQQPIYTAPANTQSTFGYSGTANNYGSAFDRLAVTTNSSAVLVYDLQTGQPLYEKNINATRSIASVTKVMTAMVVLDSGLDLREELVISGSDLVGAKQASTRLKAGDRLSRSEFMLMMLMKSENPAAKTLATNYPGGFSAFIAAMNQKAQSLGMYQTRFSDSSGLDPRNVSSASDLGKMMREVATNPRYQTIRNFSTARSYDFYINNYNLGSRTYSAANTSRVVRNGQYQLGASKTGFIREAGYCVVMESQINGRPAIIVLLGAGSSDRRWSDANRILDQLAYR